MSQNSKIEWTDATWNPVRGCTKISPGCKHCYAEVFAERFRGVPNHPYEQGFDLRLVPEKLQEPLKWRMPRLIFVNSMSDLFQEGVPDNYVVRVAEVMNAASWHTFQVLTKRADRMRALLNSKLNFAARSPHIWWGVSVENRKHGLPRIAELRGAKAAMRFLSVEPLLDGHDARDYIGDLQTQRKLDAALLDQLEAAFGMREQWCVSLLESVLVHQRLLQSLSKTPQSCYVNGHGITRAAVLQ